jgi:hypothetical protein
MKVTDTLEEQEILEKIIEQTKPPIPPGCEGLDFLLMTPFRYSAQNPNGSRFRRPNAPDGVFYAAEHSSTAIAELVVLCRVSASALATKPRRVHCFRS